MSATHLSGPLVLGSGSVESMTAATTLTANDDGKTFILNTAGGFAITLPSPTSGYRVKFIVGTAPTTAYIINSADADNIINGQISTGEDAAGSVVTAAAADVINFVANLAIIGDYVEMVSDGTSWFISGMCAVQDGMTTVQTA